MDCLLIAKGFIIGLILASPFGPVGLIFIQRSLANEKYEGIASGLGIASGDMVYSIITTLGITILYDLIINHLIFLKIIALGVLVYMSWKTMSIKVEFKVESRDERSVVSAYLWSFLLSLHNPSTIIIFAFLFGLFRVGEIASVTNAVLLISGIFAGSSLLWFVLNHFIHRIKETGKFKYLYLFYRTSGILLMIISLIIIMNVAGDLFLNHH